MIYLSKKAGDRNNRYLRKELHINRFLAINVGPYYQYNRIFDDILNFLSDCYKRVSMVDINREHQLTSFQRGLIFTSICAGNLTALRYISLYSINAVDLSTFNSNIASGIPYTR